MQAARGSETGRRCVRSSRCHLPLCCNQHVVTGTSRTAPHHAASGLTAARLHVHEPGMDNHNPYLESVGTEPLKRLSLDVRPVSRRGDPETCVLSGLPWCGRWWRRQTVSYMQLVPSLTAIAGSLTW